MLQKIEGGGNFVQNSQFIIYKDIILVIKLNGPNLCLRIEFYFTCYAIYEPARHEPVSRARPPSLALDRFLPRKSKKLRFLAQKIN